MEAIEFPGGVTEDSSNENHQVDTKDVPPELLSGVGEVLWKVGPPRHNIVDLKLNYLFAKSLFLKYPNI